MVKNKKIFRLSLATVCLLFIVAPKLVSAQYSSSNYQTNEYMFGVGGDPEVSSTNYKAQAAAGALGVGQVSSTNYQAFSGFLTPNEPFLEFGIDTSSVNLGTLDISSNTTGTASFHVRSYLNSGYIIKTMSQPPSMTSGASHTLCAMGTDAGCLSTTALPGTEQFGINLVDNASPNVGTNPSPQPDGTFATGQAASGYNSADNFKYNAGDTIAQTNTTGWGLTNYTISYIANISVMTPAGTYSVVQDLVAVATY